MGQSIRVLYIHDDCIYSLHDIRLLVQDIRLTLQDIRITAQDIRLFAQDLLYKNCASFISASC